MFDIYYEEIEQQFSFFRFAWDLLKNKRYKKLSLGAKVLYSLMLSRRSLSMRNGWLDKNNRVYIYFSVEEITEILDCSKPTATKMLAELDSKNGIGLIERKKQGQGKLDIIYVNNFFPLQTDKTVSEDCSECFGQMEMENVHLTSCEADVVFEEEVEPPIYKEDFAVQGESMPSLEVKNFYFQGKENLTSVGKKFCTNSYINNNYINNNNINPNPIYSNQYKEEEKNVDVREECALYVEQIKNNIEYDSVMQYQGNNYEKQGDKGLYEELFQIMCDIVCVSRKNVKISGECYPYELVKSKFLKLKRSHLEYVIECMKKNVVRIGNGKMKAYITTCLYNALHTMHHYYQQEVQCDLYEDFGIRAYT